MQQQQQFESTSGGNWQQKTRIEAQTQTAAADDNKEETSDRPTG